MNCCWIQFKIISQPTACYLLHKAVPKDGSYYTKAILCPQSLHNSEVLTILTVKNLIFKYTNKKISYEDSTKHITPFHRFLTQEIPRNV